MASLCGKMSAFGRPVVLWNMRGVADVSSVECERIFVALIWCGNCTDAAWGVDAMRVQSLTVFLSNLGDFAVDVVYSGASRGDVWADEAAILGDDALFVREVRLLLDGVAVVAAKSVCRADDVAWRTVLDCGQQSLGARLFGGAMALQRSPFVFVRLPEDFALVHLRGNWARRSVFDDGQGRLVLTECFLPELARFLNKQVT